MSTISAIASTSPTASDQKMDYMKLLIAQLQNQNPMEPMNNNEMAAQMGMFSQLENLENMNKTFTDVLNLQQMTQATDMIGKEVDFNTQTGQLTGRVDHVEVAGGEVSLLVGGTPVKISDVVSIRE